MVNVEAGRQAKSMRGCPPLTVELMKDVVWCLLLLCTGCLPK